MVDGKVQTQNIGNLQLKAQAVVFQAHVHIPVIFHFMLHFQHHLVRQLYNLNQSPWRVLCYWNWKRRRRWETIWVFVYCHVTCFDSVIAIEDTSLWHRSADHEWLNHSPFVKWMVQYIILTLLIQIWKMSNLFWSTGHVNVVNLLIFVRPFAFLIC